MTAQAIKEQSSYRARFEELLEGVKEAQPSWLARLREGAFGRFEERGFPTTDEEDWKYTSVAPIARGEFRPAKIDEGAADRHAERVAHLVSADNLSSRFRPRAAPLPSMMAMPDPRRKRPWPCRTSWDYICS